MLLYHLVCPIKYRRSVLSGEVEVSLVEVCKNISERYKIHFIEIGAKSRSFFDTECTKISVEIIVRTVKSITEKEIFRLYPKVKSKLGGDFLTSGYYINTVGQYGNENVFQKYIQNQGEEKTVYKSFNKNQLRLTFQ